MLFSFFNTKTSAAAASALDEINKYLDLKDFNDLNVFLQEITENIGNFLVITYENKFDFIVDL